MPPTTQPLPERIAARLVRTADDCFEWIGLRSKGYGVISVDGRKQSVHRLVWEITNGPIPEGMQIDHLCANTACANPDHLEVVSPAVNTRRAYERRRRIEVFMARPPARAKRKLPKILTRDEMAALMKAPNLGAPTSLRNRCMLELMYRAGLRVGEVVALNTRDVDISNGTVRIFDGKGGDGTAYFDPAVIGDLLDRWKERRRRLEVPREARLFCTLRGGPVSTRYMQKMIKRMAARANITATCTPHVLRHTFATELLDEGFSIREVQEALRHRDVSTTQIYTHVVDTQLRAKIQSRRRAA